MLKIVIPVSAILTIVTVMGVLLFMGDMNRELNERDVEGISNVTTEYIVDEVESEVKNKVIAPIVPYIVVGIVAIAKLFGITLIFK